MTKTGEYTYDITVEYAAADHSDGLALAVRLLKNGEYISGSYKPVLITPGKGKAVVKMINADPFDQAEISLYGTSDKMVYILKRFDYSEDAINSVQVTKKSATEYVVNIQYNRAVSPNPASVGVFMIENGQPVPHWGYSPEKAVAGTHNAVLKVGWIGASGTPSPFHQVKAVISSPQKEYASKTIDYVETDPATADAVKSFKVVGDACNSLDFTVDYAYNSNQSKAVKVVAKAMNGGYPIDWLKCTPQNAQKGNGVATLKCNFGNATTMPPGVYAIDSNQILVQLLVDGNSTPLATKTFPLKKAWSLDDLSNFKIVEKTDTVVTFTVDYAYNSSHGTQVNLGGKAVVGGVPETQTYGASQKLSKGTGKATGKVAVPTGGKKIDEVYVFLFETSGKEFFAKTFDYNKTGTATVVSPGAAKVVKPGAEKNLVKAGAAKIADPSLKKVVKPDGLTNPVKKSDTIGRVGDKLSAVKLTAQAAAGNKVALKWSPKDSAVKRYQVERKRGPRPRSPRWPRSARRSWTMRIPA